MQYDVLLYYVLLCYCRLTFTMYTYKYANTHICIYTIRVPWEESKRLDKDIGDNAGVGIQSSSSHSSSREAQREGEEDREGEGDDSSTHAPKSSRRFDPECYDDRPFYSMLLKVTH